MGHFTKLDEAAVVALAADFSLGELSSWRSIDAGTINSNYFLETDRGRFFLRINEGKSEAQVAYEIAVLRHLVGGGIPTPLPRAAHDGKRYLLWRGKPVSVFDWLPGRHVDSQTIGTSHCREVGRVLAKLHQVGADADAALSQESRYHHEQLRSLYQSFADSSDPALQEVIATIAAEFSWLDAQSERRAHAERGLIHADLFPDNVLLVDDEVAALLDFEQACTGAFVYDLAVTINAWCFAAELVPARMREMVRAYQVLRPMPEQTRGLLLTELRASALRFTITRVTDVHLRGSGQEGKDFRRFLMRLRTWQDMSAESLSKILTA